MSTPMDDLLARMWREYITLNPEAHRVADLFASRGEQVENDHIAFRTLGFPEVGIDVLARPFLADGWVESGTYLFPEKKLRARHYQSTVPGRPLVFISELDVDAFGPEIRRILRSLVDQIPPGTTERFDFCCSGRPWSLDRATWRALAEVSEYAGWVAAFGFLPNHFTVLVNSLRTLPSLQAVNDLLEQNGFALNASGGKIKGTPEQLLEQSSTLANAVDVPFSDGVARVPSCYYEFARRYAGPDGALYRGFIAASADRIFESTNRR